MSDQPSIIAAEKTNAINASLHQRTQACIVHSYPSQVLDMTWREVTTRTESRLARRSIINKIFWEILCK